MEQYPLTQQQSETGTTSTIDLVMSANANPPAILQRQQQDSLQAQMLANIAQPSMAKYMNQRDRILMHQLNQYYMMKATTRSKNIAKTIQEVVKIVQDVLRELEIQEPRFISTFTEINGHYEGKIDTILFYRRLSARALTCKRSAPLRLILWLVSQNVLFPMI